MRAVSFFGSKEGGIEGGRTDADNGRGAAGADCGGEGTGVLPVSRTGNWIRTVSRGLPLGFGAAALQADAAAPCDPSLFLCEPSLFLVGQVRPLLSDRL
jgi:hypothetical protein